jgi:hypothetical protein
MDLINKIKKETGGAYSYEMLMEKDEIYGYVNGLNHLWSDKTLATLTAGCLRIDAKFFSKNEEKLPAYVVFVRESLDAKEWYIYGSPDSEVPEIDDDFELNMLKELDAFKDENELSYSDPDFEALEGKIIKDTKKEPEEGELSMT